MFTPAKTESPAIPSLPAIPTSSVDLSDIAESKEMMESFGKYTCLMVSPGSYKTWPKVRAIGFNSGDRRLYSALGSDANRRLTTVGRMVGCIDGILNRASTGHQINDQYDRRYDEQEMYQAPTDVRYEPK
jgi:hypothetical protein